MVSRAAGEEGFSGGRREEGWEEIKEGEVALVYVPYRAEGNAGLDESVPGRCGRFTLEVYRTWLKSTPVSLQCQAGVCRTRSKSVPRESLEVYTKRDSVSVVSPMSGPGL